MIVKKDGRGKNKYFLENGFSEDFVKFCNKIRRSYGNKSLTFIGKYWRFNNYEILFLLKNQYPEMKLEGDVLVDFLLAKRAIGERIKKNKLIEKIKEKKKSDIEINEINGSLWEYQKIGVEFFEANNGTAILADQMGSGKTLQVLSYISKNKLNKSLIICPASVKYSWENEIEKWTSLKPVIVNSKNKLTQPKIDKNDIIVVNYDILRKYIKLLRENKWDIVVMDEFHLTKNSSAQRTKCAKFICKKSDKKILLSGTPILNKPKEIFNALNIINSDKWSDERSFQIRYCEGRHGKYGWEANGATNIPELRKKMSPYFLRREKKDILSFLPPKNYINYPIELDTENQKKYDEVLHSFVKYLKNVKNKNEKEIERSLKAEKLVKLNELRMITTEGKKNECKLLIDSLLENGEKIIVFSVYNKILEELHSEYKNSVLLTGKTKDSERRDVVNNFQKDENIKIFFGGLKSSGVGITLTEASVVVFIDYDWVPANHDQAVDRVHRPGQKANKINIYQLYSKNTIDEKIREILEDKKAMFDMLINGRIEGGGSDVVNELIKMIEKDA